MLCQKLLSHIYHVKYSARKVSYISTLWYWNFLVLFYIYPIVHYAPAFLHSSCQIDNVYLKFGNFWALTIRCNDLMLSFYWFNDNWSYQTWVLLVVKEGTKTRLSWCKGSMKITWHQNSSHKLDTRIVLLSLELKSV